MSILLNGSEDIEKFEEGDILFKEGDLPEVFFLIVSGKVTCLKKSNDRLVPVFTASEQEIVGEDCVLADSNKYFYSAVAMEECSVIRIEKSEVFKFLSTQKEWISNILKNISGKIQHTTDLIAEHRIIEDKLLGDVDFTEAMEAQLRKKL